MRAHAPSDSPFPRLSPRDTLAVVVLVAAIGGWAETAITWFRAWRLYEPTDLIVGPEAFWTGPLAALTVLLPIAVGFLLVDRVVPRLQLRRAVVPVVAFAATYSLIVGSRVGIESWPARLLAAGVAAGIGRLLTRDGVRQRMPLRSMATAVAASLLLVGVITPAQRVVRERLVAARLTDAAADAPNVIVLIWDTARAANLTPWGAPADVTPTLASLAAGGLTYERAFAPASWSLPSHASMFTGRWPHELSASYRAPLDDTQRTIGEAMQQRGYATAGITANLFFGRSTFGLDRGFQHYDDRPELSVRSIGQSWYVARRILEKARDRFGDRHQNLVRRSGAQINDAFLAWVDANNTGRPFFAVLNQFDAHEPYLPPGAQGAAVRAAGTRYWFDEDSEIATHQTQRELLAAYEECLRYLDQQLARLVNELERRGLRDNTVLVITSDHGEEFGDRGSMIVGHQRNLNAPVLGVPLIVVDPRRHDGGTRVTSAVSLRDIPATILELVDGRGSVTFPGQSLVAVAEGRAEERPQYASLEQHPWIKDNPGVPSSWGRMYSVIDGHDHYIVDGRQVEWLYDLASDPWERHNLRSLGLAHVRERLGAARATVASIQRDGRPAGAGSVTLAGDVDVERTGPGAR